jgi:hypothetical protein
MATIPPRIGGGVGDGAGGTIGGRPSELPRLPSDAVVEVKEFSVPIDNCFLIIIVPPGGRKPIGLRLI